MEQPSLLEESAGGFAVELDAFSGPFEVLLTLIARKRLDITEVALGAVTDEFLAFVAAQDEADLSQMSEFVVVAATLLDLKAARLLPKEDRDDDDNYELLEARDLLFAKLLQYRAFKEVAAVFAARLASQSLAYARDVPLEEYFRSLLPEVQLRATAADLARIVAGAFSRTPPIVRLDHLHDPLVPVETQVSYIRDRLIVGDRVSFASLCADAENIPTIVSRFMAVLEMLRDGEVRVEQEAALAALIITRVAPGKSKRGVVVSNSGPTDVGGGAEGSSAETHHTQHMEGAGDA
ncbi:segregation and condensation protein A [Arcanobacterium wilhelmae]|uniref:Segregation and condensation protein A n=1 Tax=Arcanobacterium wilhelmae TaxID=1803177 RepID=A0ABT9N8H1_9ACTO|nr:ScpA family protein [Arcanobacterium wilhelmae]MDP9800000.1 segregation and condensation protein A [Arcanobacterium wilhelmae]